MKSLGLILSAVFLLVFGIVIKEMNFDILNTIYDSRNLIFYNGNIKTPSDYFTRNYMIPIKSK